MNLFGLGKWLGLAKNVNTRKFSDSDVEYAEKAKKRKCKKKD